MTPTHPLDRLRVGMRAVVRHRLDDGLTDALGEVVALDETSVSVATRRGVHVVHRAAVVPPRRCRRHRRVEARRTWRCRWRTSSA